MSNIPRYIEQLDPGFQELSIETLGDTPNPEAQELHRKLVFEVRDEFLRLKLTRDHAMSLAHQHGIQDLKSADNFALALFRDYLKKIKKVDELE